MKQLKFGPYNIVYAGRDFGNMLFSCDKKAGDSQARLEKFRQDHPAKHYVVIMAEGKTEVIDLGKKRLRDTNYLDCDGLITTDPETALFLFPADCIPLAIYSVSSNLRALIHIGRRNAEKKIHLQAINRITKDHGETLKDLRLFVGPSIKKRSYFFESIDSGQLADPGWYDFIDHKNGKYYIDLLGYVLRDLFEARISKSQIKATAIDTGSDPSYFSHSRSVRTGEAEGRNLFVFKHNID